MTMITLNECEIDNALMHMKDQLLHKYAEAIDVTDHGAVIKDRVLALEIVQTLADVEELWTALHYHYKGREICQRLEEAVSLTLSNLPHQAHRKRVELKKIGMMADQLYR